MAGKRHQHLLTHIDCIAVPLHHFFISVFVLSIVLSSLQLKQSSPNSFTFSVLLHTRQIQPVCSYPAMASKDFNSTPWESQSHGSVTLLHKHSVAYKTGANDLQNLDIWIPTSIGTKNHVVEASKIPSSKGPWVIYIHGGAWRDPLVTASSFTSTVSNLATNHSQDLAKIAGIASINYSLTPRSIDPSSPDFTYDPSRQAKHPDHIIDVLTAIAFLQSKAGFGSNYVLLGHSCGATLAYQVAMSHSRWSSAATALKVAKPVAVVGLNGLYDMPTLIENPGEKHASLKDLYELFTRLAFGDDKKVWQEISPTYVKNWDEEWKEGQQAFVVQSKDDCLVPYSQTVDMKKSLEDSRAKGLRVGELDAGGDHNDLWKDGTRLAEIVVEVLTKLG